MMVMLFIVGFSKYFAQGPVYPKTGFDKGCRKIWWKHLLYINNWMSGFPDADIVII